MLNLKFRVFILHHPKVSKVLLDWPKVLDEFGYRVSSIQTVTESLKSYMIRFCKGNNWKF